MLSLPRSSSLPTLGAVIGMAAGTLTTSLPAHAQGFHDTEGLWFSGYQRGRGEEINIELTVIQDIGKMEIQFRRWEPVGSAACEYVFNNPDAATITPVINGSFGTPEACPASFTIGFDRAGPDTANIIFKNSSFLDQAEAFSSLRPLRDQDRRVAIDDLDILGLATGMSQTSLEASLSEMGFNVLEDETRRSVARDQSWQQETIQYGRQPMEDGKIGDIVMIQYAATFEGQAADPVSIAVQRDWTVPQDQNITQLTLLDALNDKYGPSIGSGDDRAWDRTGENLTAFAQRRTACSSGTLQAITNRFGNDQTNINLYCGPEANIRVPVDGGTGRARSVNISIIDSDEVWDNFWRTWAQSEYQTMRTLFEGVTQASDSAPEL